MSDLQESEPQQSPPSTLTAVTAKARNAPGTVIPVTSGKPFL